MFDALLIANRGEIACRVIRTARRLGIRTIAVYSDADASARHVREADEAVRLGPAPAAESYLDIDAVIDAARRTGAGAIHPGYGFLSENAAFARACEAAGIVFVGPPAAAIEAMGSKIEAKRLVEQAGTPIVPGYQGDDQDDATLAAEAERIGYPLLIKASAGGGGKGMRRVDDGDGFADALAGARREARAAFGDDRVLLERYLQSPKHIEVQVLADAEGNVVHLFERDCSVQRRHQKVVEEAPGPGVDAQRRRAMGEAAVRATAAIGYRGAGTIEFIADAGGFYFMEMNTRLQVEHPVTEAITGLDLVEWQLRVAAGEPLPFAQEDLRWQGHAVEARIYAENPQRGFLPSTGRLLCFDVPDGVRVDSGVEAGDAVTVHYDPMLAKVIAHGDDRTAAVAALDGALADLAIAGVAHNVAFLRRVLADERFRRGDYTTHLIDEAGPALLLETAAADWICAALALRAASAGEGAWGVADGFRLNQPSAFAVTLTADDEARMVSISGAAASVDGDDHGLADVAVAPGRVRCRIDDATVTARTLVTGDAVFVMRGGGTVRFATPVLDVAALAEAAGGAQRIVAPMPGQVIRVAVAPGDAVRAGQILVVVEAMKMEHSVTAPRDGIVAALACAEGDRVEDGMELVTLEA
ncbi:MAG: 3-methylcrotonyl-CoA carboxylase [Gammaproteobacteria bacterium]|nr:3-methylcrotonyl-CoA carboxylase [Gammaproteobacteria bacterium]MBK82165.1 3-methylcrotonyl-CoA carboxylase [Gammaproteobacteria bacterium]